MFSLSGKSWYMPPSSMNPSYWRVCRPYWIENSSQALTDDEIIQDYSEGVLNMVLQEEAVWKAKWGGLSSIEAMKKSADESNRHQ